MTLVGWIVFGLITGFVASGIVNQRGQGCILNVALGIVGAFIGGFIFTRMGGGGITGFNVYSMFGATVGAGVVLLACDHGPPPIVVADSFSGTFHVSACFRGAIRHEARS